MRQIICVNCESVLAMPSEAGVLKQCFCKETKVIREENRCFYCGPAIALMIDEHSLTVAARNLELNATQKEPIVSFLLDEKYPTCFKVENIDKV